MKTVYVVVSSKEQNKIDDIQYVFVLKEEAKIYIEEAIKIRKESNQIVPEFSIKVTLLIE